jgi:5-methylcytosine-specific restriction protein A
LTEGEKVHVEFEKSHRNQALRQACIEKYGYQCQCCGMDFVSLYGEELGKNFIEVHHLKMISTFDESQPEDFLENLVPLCSNCHSMIHHGKEGPLSLAELREAYKGEKKEIKVWKED